ncbi:protein translocase subunit SecD [bacterium]|nr:protein translocase subunit SecD [bacterium]
MRNHLARIVTVAASILFAALAVWDPSKFKLGPDLSGGTILIYRVQNPANVNLEEMLPALKERLDPAGLKNYVIRPLGNDRIEVVMPKAEIDEVENVKLRISTVGQLDFRIVADRRKHGIVMESAEEYWDQKRLQVGKEGVFVPYGIWEPVLKAGSNADKDLVDRAAKAQGLRVDDEVWFRPIESVPQVKITDDKYATKEIGGRKFVLSRWTPGELGFSPEQVLLKKDEDTGEHYALMFLDRYNVTGEFLTRVDQQLDDNNRVALNFNFNDEGANRFRQLTTEYKPDGDYRYHLGIILDGRLRSAPTLNAVISNSGIISGNFTQAEIKALERILESGKLPYALEKDPVQERTIGPSLGEDTIRSGAIAIAVSFAIVVIFTLAYYRFCGFIAVFALFLNLLFTVALMVLFQATWTLPGLAGLVLTVGMAVDSNVLIFERMREELDLGRPLGLAIRAGYEKAWGTIFDSNLTTILTALILFWIGTDQVKGFAVTLILGLLTSMFSAVFVTRLIFDVLYDNRWLRQVSMARFLSNPNIDFLRLGRACAIGSILLITAGLAAVAYRGWNMLDIDFTGGTAAGLQFKEPTTTGEVRAVASSVVHSPSVISMSVEGDKEGTRFLVRTDERDLETTKPEESIRTRIAKAFEGKLVTVSVQAGTPTDVTAEEESDPRLKAYIGGKQVELSFDPPQALAFAQRAVSDVVAKIGDTKTDPSSRFLLVPSEKVESGQKSVAKFTLASKEDLTPIISSLTQKLNNSVVFDPFDQFGAQIARETQLKANLAMALSWLGIIIYIWFRFGSWTFGVAGVVALVHDVLVAIGLTAIVSLIAVQFPAVEKLLITDMRINLDIVAALLTLIGFSINDTIVIFDRIRELKGKSPRITRDIVHRALNGTLSRTIITSLTVFFVVLVLFIFGGESLHGFAFVLVVGTITGTYSTIYIACPLVLLLEDWREGRSKNAGKPTAATALAK